MACLHFFGEVFDGKKHAVCAGYGCTEDSALGGFVTREHRALEAAGMPNVAVRTLLVLPHVRLGFAWLRREGWAPNALRPRRPRLLLLVQAFELHPILVCDPVCPTNNVAKGCYRIAQIQRVFQQAAGAAIAAANAAVDLANVAGSRDEPEALTLADASILAALNLK